MNATTSSGGDWPDVQRHRCQPPERDRAVPCRVAPPQFGEWAEVLYSNLPVYPYPISRKIEIEDVTELDGSVATELESPQLGESLYIGAGA